MKHVNIFLCKGAKRFDRQNCLRAIDSDGDSSLILNQPPAAVSFVVNGSELLPLNSESTPQE